jgi:hypothetical protein
MSTKSYTIQNLITPLATKGVIDGDREFELYNEALKRLDEIKTALLPFGATLVANPDRKGIMMVAIGEDNLDDISDRQGAHPIVPAIQQSTRNYKESVALVFFRRCLNQEADLGGEEIWIDRSEVHSAIRQAYARVFDRDDYAQKMRFDTILTRLKNDNLLVDRVAGNRVQWRGTKWLAIALNQDAIRQFEAHCGEILHTYGAAPQAAHEATEIAETSAA